MNTITIFTFSMVVASYMQRFMQMQKYVYRLVYIDTVYHSIKKKLFLYFHPISVYNMLISINTSGISIINIIYLLALFSRLLHYILKSKDFRFDEIALFHGAHKTAHVQFAKELNHDRRSFLVEATGTAGQEFLYDLDNDMYIQIGDV